VKINATHQLSAPREQVWAALTDPSVLARTIPGCVSLERTGEDEYRVTVEAGVASIRGVYSGTVALADQQPPHGYTLRASGQGGPGTIEATAAITLAEADGGTMVTYDADAVIGGTIGGVGQRVLTGVGKRTAADFFSAIEAELAGAAEEPLSGLPPVAPLYPGRPRREAVPIDARSHLVAAVIGGLIALAGVLVGRRTAS
jgi:carbon monoxide dehydrogenase subunit G